ncbi:hypothetical protein GGR54DRAFT_263839 [Hypoxylon sp. NC1633]|nr:hypothetical protein GGR54DRAFT_263839 [Hypoxylon sp. NC1633]
MLTTIAIAPSCLTQTWISHGFQGPSSTGPQSVIGLGNQNDPSCWPGGRDLSTTISPAICPSGYVSACDASPRGDASETVWACCPSGFHCDGGWYSCVYDVAPGVYTANDTDRFGNTIITSLLASGINAHSIRVAFHSSDLANLVTTAVSTVLSSASYRGDSDFSIASSTPTPTPAPAPTASNSGSLSTGATAGVGVGAGVGVFILLSVVAWLALKRYRSRRQATISEHEAHRPMSKPDSYSAPRGLTMGMDEVMGANEAMVMNEAMGVNEVDGAPGLHELNAKMTHEAPTNQPKVDRDGPDW